MTISPRLIVWVGFIACVLSAANEASNFLAMAKYGIHNDIASHLINVAIGFIGIIGMLLGEYLKIVDQRLMRLEGKRSSAD